MSRQMQASQQCIAMSRVLIFEARDQISTAGATSCDFSYATFRSLLVKIYLEGVVTNSEDLSWQT
jgi:hypothetical protein